MSGAGIHVVYEDHHLLVLNKPAPLLTQAPPGVPSLEALAKAYLKEKFAKPAGVYLGVPHRLDRPVSGIVVFARNSKAAARVHQQFHDRTVRKVYWAIVEGDLDLPAAGEIWVDWVRKLPLESRTERAVEGEPGAKRAELHARVLRRSAKQTWLELAPLTGRMHQLRAQCAWRGHPVLGDQHYGSERLLGPLAETSRDRVIALHAQRLTLLHPFGQGVLQFAAPPPDDWPSEVDLPETLCATPVELDSVGPTDN